MVFEEDIEDAVESAVKTMGPQGRYDNDSALQDVIILAGSLGRIWYGDTTQPQVDALANVLKHEIVVIERSTSWAHYPTAVYRTYPTE